MYGDAMKRAWIDVVDESLADGELAEAYAVAGAKPASGEREAVRVDNIIAVHSLHPQTMVDHLELYKTIMHRASGLSRIEREIMAVVVSTINECHY